MPHPGTSLVNGETAHPVAVGDSSAYVVLARRWRPRRFDTLVGQGHVTRSLVNALTSGRIPHAFLFTGIRGVGKTTLARLLAMCLNCEGGVSAEPCGTCGSCREIIAGNHPDVLEIDAASRTKVEQMREVLDMVGYAPTASRHKIYILDEVHMLSNQSFNALLKTLEEPPPHVHFIFATTEARKIPATVLSRCQRFGLKRVPADILTAHLRGILEKESVAFDAPALAAVVRAAEGSVRDALSILDQVISHGDGVVGFEAVKELLGLSDQGALRTLLDHVLAGRGPETLEAVGHFYGSGADPESLVNDLLDELHRATRHRVTGAGGDTPGRPAETLAEPLGETAAAVSLEHLQMVFQVLLRGGRDLKEADNPLQALEMLLLRAAYLKPVPDLARMIAAIGGETPSGSKRSPGSGGSAGGGWEGTPTVQKTASVVVEPAVSSPPVDSGQLTSWKQLISSATENDPGLAMKLRQQLVCLEYRDDGRGPLNLVVQPINELVGSAESIRKRLVTFLASLGVTQATVTVKLPTDGDRPETVKEQQDRLAGERQERLEREVAGHPLVRELTDRFQAEIIRVEPVERPEGNQ